MFGAGARRGRRGILERGGGGGGQQRRRLLLPSWPSPSRPGAKRRPAGRQAGGQRGGGGGMRAPRRAAAAACSLVLLLALLGLRAKVRTWAPRVLPGRGAPREGSEGGRGRGDLSQPGVGSRVRRAARIVGILPLFCEARLPPRLRVVAFKKTPNLQRCTGRFCKAPAARRRLLLLTFLWRWQTLKFPLQQGLIPWE